ncbi:MAG: TetR family transcriptional regulator C-terminal domain-containing protein, partial [Clostridiales bacterium]|nr:TetR family transcriptional regulator C-terminal domain-containing protein [Clostridiales bacterium]
LEDIDSRLLADLSPGFPSAYKDFKSERLDQIFAMGLDMMQSHGDTLVLLFGPNGDPTFSMKFVEMAKPQILSALQINEFTPQMNTAVTFAVSGLIGVFSSWYTNGKQEPLEDIIRSSQKLLYVIFRDVFQ